jgi:hypothetical protein
MGVLNPKPKESGLGRMVIWSKKEGPRFSAIKIEML